MERWLKVFKKTAKKPKHLGPPQLPRHEQAQGPAARRHEAAAEGGEGRRLADRDRRHREVRAAERAHAVPVLGEPRRTARRSGCSRSRSGTAAASSGSTSTTGSSPPTDNRFDAGLLRTDGTARPAYNTVRKQLATGALQPVAGFPPRAARAGAAVLRHRCTAGPRGAARGGARRRGGHGPAPRQGRRATTSSCARPPCSGALCDEHGALFWLNDRPDLAGGVRRRRRARGPGRHAGCRGARRSWAARCWSGSRRTRPSSSTRAGLAAWPTS